MASASKETLRREGDGRPAAIELFSDLSVFDEPVASASVGVLGSTVGSKPVRRGTFFDDFSLLLKRFLGGKFWVFSRVAIGFDP